MIADFFMFVNPHFKKILIKIPQYNWGIYISAYKALLQADAEASLVKRLLRLLTHYPLKGSMYSFIVIWSVIISSLS